MSEFEKELARLINRHGAESASGTPDYILANFLSETLLLFNETISLRAKWRDESPELLLEVNSHGG